jgi:hypothetical protein
MWQMIEKFDPAQQMWRPAEWTGAHGCADECRPKNLALVDAPRADVDDGGEARRGERRERVRPGLPVQLV